MQVVSRISPLVACILVSTATAQQGGWLIKSSNIVSPAQPTTTVEVWAWFDDPTGERDAFASGDFDLIAADGEFSNIKLIKGSLPGSVSGNRVNGVFVGQIWGVAGIIANPQNPILFWTVDWMATDFTPRIVSLDTLNTTTFNIGTNGGHSSMNILDLFPQGFTPGTGVIEVVPSPASAVPVVLVGAVMLRRRRR